MEILVYRRPEGQAAAIHRRRRPNDHQRQQFIPNRNRARRRFKRRTHHRTHTRRMAFEPVLGRVFWWSVLD